VELSFSEVGRRSCERMLDLLRSRTERPKRVRDHVAVKLVDRDSASSPAAQSSLDGTGAVASTG
jgi:hypothetical protein